MAPVHFKPAAGPKDPPPASTRTSAAAHRRTSPRTSTRASTGASWVRWVESEMTDDGTIPITLHIHETRIRELLNRGRVEGHRAVEVAGLLDAGRQEGIGFVDVLVGWVVGKDNVGEKVDIINSALREDAHNLAVGDTRLHDVFRHGRKSKMLVSRGRVRETETFVGDVR